MHGHHLQGRSSACEVIKTQFLEWLGFYLDGIKEENESQCSK